MIHIETERLLLRDWIATDLNVFREMNADREVMAYFPNTLTNEETDRFYHAIQREWQTEGYGLYAVEVKHTHRFVGFIGFHKATFEADFTPCVEIGWRLAKAAWGQGYATEGASACLEHGFRHLGLHEVYSFTSKINQPSIHVMEKIGLQNLKEFNHPKLSPTSKLSRHVLYHIAKSDYKYPVTY
ncbi:N-acetyltransferase [Bacillus sp. HMF5848]|uniref:GNAT family N-acetyltransferase n=1 Tax=Bacillus sp. HMF5848 TaxID=2495421 RepID=UPI000F7BA4B0|nr:GNAT family N-acetyltransferase [Bacillus sp. HMF5848]RSK29112.1 N-acetyltransferase [Bacillus sp. HMF5848]